MADAGAGGIYIGGDDGRRMHRTAERLVGASSSLLAGKTVVLAVTGSIGAVRTVELCRELMRHGARVVPVMSKEAQKILHPYALEFASGVKPITEITGRVEHVDLLGRGPGKADLLLIAPCTGNTLSKIALGIDDSPVTTFACTGITTTPTLICPAMHDSMYDNPFLLENVERLRRAGVHFLDPKLEEGKAKLAEPEHIVEHVLRLLGTNTLRGKRLLVVNGATQEPIDAMRVVSNRSTGRTGSVLAREAFRLGADVEHWFGHGEAAGEPPHVPTRRFGTVDDLLRMAPDAARFDAVLVPAALGDFGPEAVQGKIPSDKAEGLTLRLRPLPKVIQELRKHVRGPLVSFKAESGVTDDELAAKARRSQQRAGSAFVVANRLEEVTPGRHRALLVDADRATPVEGSKEDLARAVLARLAEAMAR